MTTANREQQILRIKSASFQAELDEQLKEHLQQEVVAVVQTTIEVTLVEELTAQLTEMSITPPILIVDGVWVDVQYTLDEFKIDQAGHQRQCCQAEERVILVAMAVWPDGRYYISITK